MVNLEANTYHPPTYEEIYFSQPSPSDRNGRGSDHDVERQVLLLSESSRSQPPLELRMGGYQPPSVETPRPSEESGASLTSEAASAASSYARVTREMTEMDILDAPLNEESLNSFRLRTHFSKGLTAITTTISSFHRRIPVQWPSLGSIISRIPPSTLAFLSFIGRVFALVLVLLVTYFFMSTILPSGKDLGQVFDRESVREYAQGQVDGDRIRRFLKHVTSFDHIAGTQGDYVMAKYIQTVFKAVGLEDVGLNEYQVYLNYPRPSGRRVAIIDPPDMAWEARLEEGQVYPDGDPSKKQTLVFHGHSRAGNVSGPLIYANYGSREDFESLQQRGINLTGTIALVRYYGTQGDRALKVKAAELAGAVGCLIYSDPNEDGFKKGEVWPKGRWRPKDSVQRGSVSLMSWIVGDVLTPGYASTPDAKRVSKDNNPGLVNIPSLPLAWRDAQKLLQSLKGHGVKVDHDWIGGVPDIDEWWTGNQESPIINLANEQDEEEKQPIWNVLGKISGLEQKEKSVIVGNHRDAWCFGAADPGSGTAIMLEVVHILSELRRLGWRPLRTIQFASWDGEEYNLIGSTEWVEDNVDDLRRNGIGYLNVDMGVFGTEFQASASPLFQKALLRVLDRTVDPDTNHTLRSIWDRSRSKLKGLGAGSDFVAFQDIAGTSSIDVSFEGPGSEYHSCYDTFEWMDKFGDPGFRYHKVMAQVIALLILELADRPILPYDLIAYASAIHGYIKDLDDYTSSKAKNNPDAKLNLGPLREATTQFMHDAQEFHNWERTWTETLYNSGGLETSVMAIQRMSHNARMANFETHLLDLSEGGGVPGREQFKHMLFAPQAWSGYDEAYFPGVRDAVDVGNWTLAQQQVDKVAKILSGASYKLLH